MKTIKVREETYGELVKVVEELEARGGGRRTFDDAVRYLLSLRRREMGVPVDNVATEGGRMGPFIAGLYVAAVRSGEAAEKILREEGDRLTPGQRAYLEHVIEEGRRARRILEERGVRVPPRPSTT